MDRRTGMVDRGEPMLLPNHLENLLLRSKGTSTSALAAFPLPLTTAALAVAGPVLILHGGRTIALARIALCEQHLVRLVRGHLSYYHEDRCHLGLNKETPNERPVTPRPSPAGKVVARPLVGGLHHRYEWRQAA